MRTFTSAMSGLLFVFVLAALAAACSSQAGSKTPADSDSEDAVPAETEQEETDGAPSDGDDEREADPLAEKEESIREESEPEPEPEPETNESEVEPEMEAERDSEIAVEEDTPICAELPKAPGERVWPVFGELTYIQLRLGGFSMGESGLLIGPEGSLILFDVGNNSHDDEVRALINEVIARMNQTPGFAPRADDEVDHLILTHYHADHSDGLEDLLAHVSVRGRLVHRGLTDITEAVQAASIESVCRALQSLPEGRELALCVGPGAAPCSLNGTSDDYPSDSCPGLNRGDILESGGTGPSYLPLGDEARIEFLAANGRTLGHSYESEAAPLLRDDSNGENARSVVTLIRHGAFRFLHGADLTGGGSDTDAVEGFYASAWEEAGLDVAGGVDVLHLGHHGRDTSSSQAWLDLLLPKDGASRNALMAVSRAHLGSPHAEVLTRVTEAGRLHLGGMWTNTVTVGGADHALLHKAQEGLLLIATRAGGASYVVQAISPAGAPLASEAFHSVAACHPPANRH